LLNFLAGRCLPYLAMIFLISSDGVIACHAQETHAQAAHAQETHAQVTHAQSTQTQENLVSEQDVLSSLSTAATIYESESEANSTAPRGFTAAFSTITQHDSSNRWSSLLAPYMAYRLNSYFSVDMSGLLYVRINIDANVGTKAKPLYAFAPKSGAFGDTTLAFHGNARVSSFDYTGTFSAGLPSGNTAYGLGAGQVTYSMNHHFDRSFNYITPDLELGFGDTSSLVDQRVLKDYISVGPMAHFQLGSSFNLPLRMTFEANAYEELPLDKNLVYSTTGSGKKKVTTATNIDPAEDNGFITSLDIPLSKTITMSGFYNRSLRDHDDVAGFSFTFVLAEPHSSSEPHNKGEE
jgi:hypothetical protein